MILWARYRFIHLTKSMGILAKTYGGCQWTKLLPIRIIRNYCKIKMEKILDDNGIRDPSGYTPNGRPKHYRIRTSIFVEKSYLTILSISSFKIKCPDLNIEGFSVLRKRWVSNNWAVEMRLHSRNSSVANIKTDHTILIRKFWCR